MFNYFLYYGIIIPLSYLPLSVLYLLSNLLYFVIYRLIGYRRKVVFTNLKNSFPQKTHKELKSLEKNFYRHFVDLIVESIKTFTISAEEAGKRMKVRNPELINSFYQKEKSIVGVGGHNGNWELYAVACTLQIPHDVTALYTPIKNKFFDKIMRQNRSRYGLNMIPTYAKDDLPVNRQKPQAFLYGIDQCPKKKQRAYWMDFLNQETAVQFGAEKFARDYNLPVVFGNIYKVKRGYYEVEYKIVCEDPSELPVGGILEKSTRYLEKAIQEQPAYWLWSHKRWKYGRNEA